MTMKENRNPAKHAGWRCAIVDDNPISLMFMRKILQKHRIETLEAHDVQGTIRLLATEPVTCVITDIHLPDGSGWDILQYIRNSAQLSHVAVFATTASMVDSKVVDGLQFDGNLGKPFTENELLALLGRHDADFQRPSK